jgi:hypothetical protein
MAAATERKVVTAALEMLVGRSVVRVRYMRPAEAAGLGWSQRPAVLEFDDGTVVYAACDEEANDAAVLFVETSGGGECCLGRFAA